MLGRIRALLAKAEATGFPEEAEALSAKAKLMARHSVDEALLAAGRPSPETPGACRIGVEPPYEQAKAVLLDAVAAANHCRGLEPLGFSTVVGFETDLEAVELLYTSLLVQATTAMTKAEAAERAAGRKRTKTFRQSFLAAYAPPHRHPPRGGRRYPEATEDLLPVLASRDVAVTGRLGLDVPWSPRPACAVCATRPAGRRARRRRTAPRSDTARRCADLPSVARGLKPLTEACAAPPPSLRATSPYDHVRSCASSGAPGRVKDAFRTARLFAEPASPRT
ncbi:hypothetical protein SBADM41S_08730 [Streptomyces badius]